MWCHLVVEEPSIVAGLSGAARMARLGGGFTVAPVDPVLIGQVQIVIDSNPEQVKATLLEHREDIVALANSLHPKMVARGGGALDIEVFDYQAEERRPSHGGHAPAGGYPRRHGREFGQHHVRGRCRLCRGFNRRKGVFADSV